MDLAAGIPANIKQIEMLYKKMTNFKSLFQSYELEVLPSELVRLHPLVSALLVTIMEKVEHLYARKYPRRVHVHVDQNLFDFFPAFQQHYRLDYYIVHHLTVSDHIILTLYLG